jgi:hypothetical protein
MFDPIPRPPPQRRRRNGLTTNTRTKNKDKGATDIIKPQMPIYTTVSPDMLVLNRSPPSYSCRSPTLVAKEEVFAQNMAYARARALIPFDVMQGDGTGFPGYDPRYWQTNNSSDESSDYERL